MLESLNVVAPVVPEIRHVQNREFTMPSVLASKLKPRFFLNFFLDLWLFLCTQDMFLAVK